MYKGRRSPLWQHIPPLTSSPDPSPLPHRLPVLSDIPTLRSALLNDVLLEARGRSGAVHLAVLLAAAVSRVAAATTSHHKV